MIFYFSATGNSRHVALAVRKRFGGVCVDMAEALLEEKTEYEFEEGEAAVFVFPVYYGGLPDPVRDFIGRFRPLRGTPEICGICTCAGMPVGSDRKFRQAFAQKGMKVAAFYDVEMPENYIFLFRPPIREAALMTLKRSEARITDVLDSMAFHHRKPFRSGPFAGTASSLMHVLYGFTRSTRGFKTGEECSGCGLCSRICPVRAITMKDGRPVWTANRCLKCTACINRCPEQTIQYGRATKKRFRYVHPDLATRKRDE